MRRDNGSDATGAQDESPAACLLNGIRRFFLDFGLIPIYQRILPDTTTDDTCKTRLRFRK